MTKELGLRDYQRDAIDSIDAARSRGIKRPAVVLPTGSGKTVIFSHLVKEHFGTKGMIGTARIIVHREELIYQTVAKLNAVAPNLRVGVVKADRNEISANVIVASIQTLRKPERAAQLRGVHLVIVDECHHAAADSYVSVMDLYERIFDAKFAGFTATMDRMSAGKSGAELGDVWEEIVYTKDVLDMIGLGYLADVRGKAVTIDGLTLSQAKVSKGDFTDVSLADLLMDNDAQNIVADAYSEHCRKADGTYRKGIVFTPTVATAQAFSAAFEARGIPSGVVWGAMPSEDRKLVFKRYAKGEIRVLHNCMIATEGFDQPDAEVAVIARPTKSAALYVQMVGRVLRPAPGKTEALVLDVVGVSEELSLATLADLSSRRVDKVEPGESLTGAAKRLAKKGHPGLKGYVNHRDVNLFGMSASLWQQTYAGVWFIRNMIDNGDSKEDRLYFLWPTGSYETFDVGVCSLRGSSGGFLHRNLDLSTARKWGGEEAGLSTLSRKGASWRKGKTPPSPAQVNFARSLGIEITDEMTKAQVSDAITRHLASRRLDPHLPKG